MMPWEASDFLVVEGVSYIRETALPAMGQAARCGLLFALCSSTETEAQTELKYHWAVSRLQDFFFCVCFLFAKDVILHVKADLQF